jgi:hypothetical protein
VTHQLAELPCCCLTLRPRTLSFAAQALHLRVDILRTQRATFGIEPLSLGRKSRGLVLELLDAVALDLRLLARHLGVPTENLPALPPVLHGLFRIGKGCSRDAVALARGIETGFQLFQLPAQLIDLRLIPRQMQIRLARRLLDLLQVLALSLAQLPRVLN